jgi:hypothetical protein
VFDRRFVSSAIASPTVAVLNKLQLDFNLLFVQITEGVQILVDFNLRVGSGKPAIPMNAPAIKCQISSSADLQPAIAG